jgi:hypothetical protein
MTSLQIEEFWSLVQKGKRDECWLWQAGHFTHGYGSYRQDYAHRIAWRLRYGPIPEGMCVLHRCDVMGCCNPRHLFLGTQADNLADMRAKGRLNMAGVERWREQWRQP